MTRFCMKEFTLTFCIIYYNFAFIGYGIFTTKFFNDGDFLLEYPGNVVTQSAALKREEEYEKKEKGCFLYYFQDSNEKLWLV